MNDKYVLVIFGFLFLTNIFSMYLMLSGNWNYFIIQLKWFLRITTPLIIIYLFYLGNRKVD